MDLLLQLLPVLVVTALLVFWAWMFWDMTNNDDLPSQAKNYWAIGFVILNVFTAAYYYVNVYRNRS